MRPIGLSLRERERDSKDGADAMPAGTAASRGREILFATANKIFVTGSLSARRKKYRIYVES